MFRFIRSSRLGAICAISTTFITAVAAKGAGFQRGDIVVVRGNTTTGALELDEYHSNGSQASPLNVVSIPSSGSQSMINGFFFGSSLKLSGDGNYLTLAGQQVVSGTAYGVVGRANVGDGTVDLSTKNTNIVGNSSSSLIPRSAVTSNGNDIWVAGIFGVGYTTLGSSTVIRVNKAIDRNTVGIFDGQLYTTGEVTSGITPPYLIGTVGNGLPKIPTVAEASLPGIPPTDDANASDFWLRDANTLYLSVQTSYTPNPGIQKWTFNGTTWEYQYNLFTFGIKYLSGEVDSNGNTALFVSSGSSLFRIVDGGSQTLSKSSSLATAAAGTNFYGVAFISAPEPASIVLMTLGAAGMFAVAKRRGVAAARITAVALCALSATLITAITAQGAGFQPGDVVALRVDNTTEAVELDEYSPNGLQTSPLNALSIPRSGDDATIITGFYPYDGVLKLSSDRKYLTFGGNDAYFPNTRTVVGRVSVSDGSIDLSTKIDNVLSPYVYRAELFSVVTPNGSDFWVTGENGVSYTSLGSSTLTRISQYTGRSVRPVVGIFGGQLYTSSNDTDGPNALSAVGSGLPIVPAPEIRPPGLPITDVVCTTDFWFRDPNTLYLTNTRTGASGGIQKWTFNGTTWQYQYNVSTSPTYYLTGCVDPNGDTVLFAPGNISRDVNGLLRIVDGGSQALSSSTLLATSANGTKFRGVAFITVPEPASIVLIAFGAAGVFAIARRRRIATVKIGN